MSRSVLANSKLPFYTVYMSKEVPFHKTACAFCSDKLSGFDGRHIIGHGSSPDCFSPYRKIEPERRGAEGGNAHFPAVSGGKAALGAISAASTAVFDHSAPGSDTDKELG